MSAVLVTARPLFAPKVYAITNQYEWTKHVDHNLLGGSYTSAASSSDGSHLIIGSSDGGEGYNQGSPLYISDDYGTTWENVTLNTDSRIRNNWSSVDVSNNGHVMVAASTAGMDLDTFNSTNGKIFVSNDSGVTWTNITPVSSNNWRSVAISGDASTIVALSGDDIANVYVSTDGGDTWQTSPVINMWGWESLSISDNGSKVLVGGENTTNASSLLYLSNDGGDTWEDVSPDMGNMVFTTRTAMSGSGDKIAVSTVGYNGSDTYDAVYESNNDGTDWTDITPDIVGVNGWSALAMSDDGAMLAVQDDENDMFVSHDLGANWAEENPDTDNVDTSEWRGIDFNATGSRIITASASFAYSGHDASLDPVQSVDLTSAETTSTITLTTPSGATITCHSPVKESGLSAQDGAYSYPLGLVDFCFSGADTSNEVTLTFVTDLKPNEVAVRKYNPTTKQYATISDAVITETTSGGKHALRVTYTIADNGPLDTDLEIGEVADPVGLAVLAAQTPNTGLQTQSSIAYILAMLTGVGLLSLVVNSVHRNDKSTDN